MYEVRLRGVQPYARPLYNRILYQVKNQFL